MKTNEKRKSAEDYATMLLESLCASAEADPVQFWRTPSLEPVVSTLLEHAQAAADLRGKVDEIEGRLNELANAVSMKTGQFVSGVKRY